MSTGKIDPRKLELLQLDDVAKTSSGRVVLGRIMAHAGVLSGTFHEEERMHVFAEGTRSHGLWLFNELKCIRESLPFDILKEFYYERDNGNNNGNGRKREPGANNPEC